MSRAETSQGRSAICLWIAGLIGVLFGGVAIGGCSRAPDSSVGEPVRVSFLSASEDSGFDRVVPGSTLTFPRDHGPHPDQQIEWWYYTGNVATEAGRRFGFELTFFRIGLDPDPAQRDSEWAARDLYMAHFAVTDPDGVGFRSFERLTRGALELAGARAEPFEVWNTTWRASAEPGTGEDPLPMAIVAADEETSLRLQLESAKPRVLHGDRGFSRKGNDPRNASMYVSFTRLDAVGEIEVDGVTHRVRGTAWMDHEWSTSVLPETVEGWDWFSLQLDDGREVMLFLLRNKPLPRNQLREAGDGDTSTNADPRSTKIHYGSGTLIDTDGSKRDLTADAFEIDATATWTSSASGVTYPSRWTIRIPGEGIDVTLEPLVADQELRVGSMYWEGAVEVRGSQSGYGYVELVGYQQ